MKTAAFDIFLKYSLHINDALNKHYGYIFRHLPQTIFGDLTHMKGDAKRGTPFKKFEKLAFSKEEGLLWLLIGEYKREKTKQNSNAKFKA